LRLGVPTRYFYDQAQSEVESAVREALTILSDSGAELREITVPDVEHAGAAAALIYYAEATAYHDDDLSSGRGPLYTSRVRRFLELGNFVLARDYLQAQRFRTLLGNRLAEALQHVDFLVTPTLPITATSMGEPIVEIREVEQPVYLALLRNTEPFNLAGLPALTVPCGFSSKGLPIGLQIVGRPFDEAGTLRVGHAFQCATDWHLRRPPPLNELSNAP
jgi:aspartyl-tRNA(Asn)/glutamyl-tRNA(Gln) amidotransferase subunit A